MSKTSMSTGVRTLLDMKMVNKVWEKGSRKDLYEVEYDWYQSFTDFFTIKWRKAIESNILVLRRSIKEMNKYLTVDIDPAMHVVLEEDIRKMNEAVKYYSWLDRLIDTMENGEIFDLVPRE
jgi:DNA-binding transcriptional regulator GbsR (MarR family)